MTAHATQQPLKDQYLAVHNALNANGAPDWVKALRVKGAEAFKRAEFPNTRIEEWRQTNIASIVNTPYQPLSSAGAHGLTEEDVAPLLFHETGMTELVFVDGYYAPELSKAAPQAGVHAGGLAEAITAGNDVVQRHLGAQLREEGAYPQLNSALIQDGAFVHAGRGVRAEHPIHFLFVTSKHGKATALHPRNLVVLEEGAEADVIMDYVSLAGDSNYLNNVISEVSVGPNARLGWYKIVHEGENGHHLETADVRLDRDARLEAFTFTMSGKIVRNKIAALLDGENASCALSGVYCNDGARLTDNFVDVTHVKPHCVSRMFYKGVLDDKSKAVFTGKVYVHPEAQQTDSNQLSNNLMLSDGATIDAKPQLEIYADDVKCTHGATVGPAPEEIIFYFRSRGISEATARAMLTYGFADEIVSKVPVDALRKRLDRYIFDKYNPKRIVNPA